MINDTVDAIGITKNNIQTPWTSNLRVTALWGWDNVNRNNNIRDDGSELWVRCLRIGWAQMPGNPGEFRTLGHGAEDIHTGEIPLN